MFAIIREFKLFDVNIIILKNTNILYTDREI